MKLSDDYHETGKRFWALNDAVQNFDAFELPRRYRNLVRVLIYITELIRERLLKDYDNDEPADPKSNPFHKSGWRFYNK